MKKDYRTLIEVFVENEPKRTYRSIEGVNDVTSNLSRFLSNETSTHMRYEVSPLQFEALPKDKLLKAEFRFTELKP